VSRPRRGLSSSALLRTYGIVLALALLVLIVTVAEPSFLAFTNLMNISSQYAPAGLMAIGMTYVILTGGFDLSIGATYTLSAVIAAALGRFYPVGFAFTVAVAAALVLGLVNGLLVNYGRINPFIATLGTSFAISGVTLVLTNNRAFVVSNNPQFPVLGAQRWHGIPYSGMLLAAAFVIGGVVLARSVYGQKIYAIGGNTEASRLAGIRVRPISISAYMLCGFCAGLGGVVTASQLSSAQPSLNSTIVFDVITMVVVGGTSLTGGFGAIWRTVVGLAILATLQNGFNLLNLDPHYQDVVKGVIIVGALAFDSFASRVANRKNRRTAHGTPDLRAGGLPAAEGRTDPAGEARLHHAGQAE
jgi:ribose transport system permease protein